MSTQLAELLGLDREPVAITFLESAPEDMPRIEEVAPAGCTYWKYASEGRSFYTEAADHYGCPIGAHTHGIDVPADQEPQLEGMVQTMVELEYLIDGEAAGIPRRDEEFGVMAYAPLSTTSSEPDVVMVRGDARQMMLLAEATHAAGVACQTSMVGRPTCAAIPEVIESGLSATNLGCIGNRVYTELGDDELYFAFAGRHVDRIVEKLTAITSANRELEKYHRERVQ